MPYNIRTDLPVYLGSWCAQAFWLRPVYQFGRRGYCMRPAVLREVSPLSYRVLRKPVQIITGIQLPRQVNVGRNFVIDHFGGIAFSGYASLDDNCSIRNGTLAPLPLMSEPSVRQLENKLFIIPTGVAINSAHPDSAARAVVRVARGKSVA